MSNADALAKFIAKLAESIRPDFRKLHRKCILARALIFFALHDSARKMQSPQIFGGDSDNFFRRRAA